MTEAEERNKRISDEIDIIIKNQSNPGWFKARLGEWKPLKENSKREQDIDDIIEMNAYSYADSQESLDHFRSSIYFELSKVSDSEIPHTQDEKRNYTRTRWANFVVNNELSKL